MKKFNSNCEVIIFDMDKTLLACDSMDFWHQFLAEKGITDKNDQDKRMALKKAYENGTLDIHENFRFEFSLLNRISPKQYSALQQEFFEKHLKSMVSAKALALIGQYKKANAIIVMSTSTMRFLADPVAAFIKADHMLATEGVMKENQYTGDIQGTPNYREGKKINYELWLKQGNKKFKRMIFYSDSIHDLDLLQMADRAVAVNPDARLQEHASAMGWEIVDFHTSQKKE